MKNRNSVFTGERVIKGNTPERIWADHVKRYDFAGRFVKKKIVLDISCGAGYGSQILCESGASMVVGVDISGDTIESARSIYQRSGLAFKVGDALDIDFHDNYFDGVVSFETIEHVKDQGRALSEIRRVLKPGGFLIISSPNRRLTSPFKLINDPPENPFHVLEYAREEFIRLLGDHFEVVDIYGQRAISALLLLPFVERMARKIFPSLYSPGKGCPELERISFGKEYRYVTAICRKQG